MRDESGQLTTPVALLVFNRPDTTARVLEAIRSVRPRQLLVVADGPRAHRPADVELCASTRALLDSVDWPCEVLKNYSAANLGCRERPASGLDWVFEKVDRAIVLEDDCLPDPSFFRFCTELLQRYEEDERVMAIGGTNVLGEWKNSQQSYHFSVMGSIWGWATWRRAWRHNDVTLSAWGVPERRERLAGVLRRIGPCESKLMGFQRVYDGNLDTWDYGWDASRLLQSGLTILPSKNLVSNIGIGHSQAIHTKSGDSPFADLRRGAMQFPLVHPVDVVADVELDRRLLALQQPSGIRRWVPEPVKKPLRPLLRAARWVLAVPRRSRAEAK